MSEYWMDVCYNLCVTGKALGLLGIGAVILIAFIRGDSSLPNEWIKKHPHGVIIIMIVAFILSILLLNFVPDPKIFEIHRGM